MVSEHSKMASETLKERMTQLETLLGKWHDDEDTMERRFDFIRNEIIATRVDGIERSIC